MLSAEGKENQAELCELFCVTDEDELSSVLLSVSDNHVDQTALVQFNEPVSIASTEEELEDLFPSGGEDTKSNLETMALSTEVAVNLGRLVKSGLVDMFTVVFSEVKLSVVSLIGMLSTSSIKCLKVAFDCERTLYTDDCGM